MKILSKTRITNPVKSEKMKKKIALSTIGGTLMLCTLSVLMNVSCNKGRIDPGDWSMPPVYEDTVVLKVMSYDIKYGSLATNAAVIDMQAVADNIKAVNPDLVALRQVDVNTTRSGVNLDEAAELGRLTGMYHYFTKSFDYRGGAFGNAVLSKYPITDSMRVEIGAIDGKEARSFAVITAKINDLQSVAFAATHLDASAEDTYRFTQIKVFLDSTANWTKLPLVLAGGLNAAATADSYKTLTEVFTPACTTCPFTNPAANPTKTTESILFKKSNMVDIVNVFAGTKTNTANLPMIAEVRLRVTK